MRGPPSHDREGWVAPAAVLAPHEDRVLVVVGGPAEAQEGDGVDAVGRVGHLERGREGGLGGEGVLLPPKAVGTQLWKGKQFLLGVKPNGIKKG